MADFGNHFPSNVAEFHRRVPKREDSELTWHILADLPDLPDVPNVVAASMPKNVPSTRAVGQGDVSLSKLRKKRICPTWTADLLSTV